MKIVIGGTINRDMVEFSDGRRLESLGGLAYSLAAMSVLAPESARIIPVCNIGDDIYDYAMDELSKFKQIDRGGLRRCDCPNNAVYLYLQEGRERDEHTDLNLPPIEYSQFEPHLDSDALMLNFTSGFELDFVTTRRIIDAYKGIVYMDIHSLTLGIDENRHRVRRKIPGGLRWIEGVDFVQATEDELRSLTGGEGREGGLDRAGKMAADRCRKACLVTRGDRGVSVFTKGGVIAIEAVKIDEAADTTGCGDVFGAAFLVSYLETGDIIKSAKFGNAAASAKCGLCGVEELSGLKDLFVSKL